MKKRMMAVLAAVAVIFTGLGVRVWWLSDDTLLQASMTQSTRKHVVATARGTIYDRYLRPLVNDEHRVVALLAPTQEAQAAIKEELEAVAASQVKACFAQGDCAVAPLSSWMAPTDGVTQFYAPIRYGEDVLACHVIGYVNGDSRGVTGIEKEYDDRLSSFTGTASVSYAVDALGHVQTQAAVRVENTLTHAAGGIALTLDRQVQELVERKASAYMERGAVLVSAVDSGDVLASVSLPLYDPNDVNAVLDDASAPLVDRTTVNYNVGSVFKIVTAAAALEHGVSADTVYTCTGSCDFGDVTIRCHNPLGDGAVTMREAMALSCNCYFMQLAADIGVKVIYETALKAGLTESFALANGCTTAQGVLPTQEDLSAAAALANFSIGQGDLLLTPHHVHRFMQAVACDGLLPSPRLYLGAVNEEGVLVTSEPEAEREPWVSYTTAEALLTMLGDVVQVGTGTEALPAIGEAAGKTGTAETGWSVDGEEVVQSWFTGCYPANDPQYVITVLSENGGNNGMPAAPLFRRICEGFLQAGLVENAQDLY
ncbi:MAG: penicillin-binding protein 2 [Clostridia bacterium]|nr:penicillin-binding protein 2 [Clostridia bacterium]